MNDGRHRLVKGILKESGIMDKIHAVSLKTDTIDEFKTTHKEKAEEILCRGGSKFEKKQAEKAKSEEKSQNIK